MIFNTQASGGGSSVDPATATPSMDGTAAVGTGAKYAREDHVHPTDTSRAASTHSHGSITSAGAITSDTSVASGDKLVIADSSDSSKLKRSGISFGSSTTTFLANNGTWQTPSGGGGGGSWTDISIYFQAENDPAITAYTNGTLVYLTASDSYGAGFGYISYDMAYEPAALAVGVGIGTDLSIDAVSADVGSEIQPASGTPLMFCTIIYPI